MKKVNEIGTTCEQIQGMFKNEVKKDTKLNLYKIVAAPSLLY